MDLSYIDGRVLLIFVLLAIACAYLILDWRHRSIDRHARRSAEVLAQLDRITGGHR